MKDILAKLINGMLPLAGSKTKIGAWLVGLGGIRELFPGVDFTAIVMYLLAHPTKAGAAAIIVGLIHKWAIAQVGDLPSVPKF